MLHYGDGKELNLLGIDFEEWYHPELIKPHIDKIKRKPKVVKGIDKILDFLRKNETYATFFIVGELLQTNPELLDKIINEDHEIGFHTMHHDRLDSVGFKEKFDDELKEFEKLTNKKSHGFRAPTFSLNEKSSWAIDMLEKNNYIYDSSVVPAQTNMYGLPNAESKPYKISSRNLEKNDENGKLIEFPLLTTKILGKKISTAGGFYLRTLPLWIIKNSIKNYEKMEKPACFYIHSWELTPEFMPKISLPIKENFVTYHNLQKAMPKMESILKEFKFTSFDKYMSN